MHYENTADAQTLRRRAVGPADLLHRRRLAAVIPTRGLQSARLGLSGLGANNLIQGASAAYGGATTGATLVGSTLSSAVSSAVAGTAFFPIVGTAIGLIVGLVASGVFNHRVDPEVGNFNNAMALYASNPQAIYNIADKYLVLAGLFDLEPGQIKGNIPIYKKYGRMGEQRFVNDMMSLVYSAAQQGRITGSDTPASVMARVVQPWIDSFGYGAMSDHNADMINEILIGLIAEYVTDLWRNRWFARGGDLPRWTFPTFALPAAAAPPPPVAPPPIMSRAYPLPVSPVLAPAPVAVPPLAVKSQGAAVAVAPPDTTPASAPASDNNPSSPSSASSAGAGSAAPSATVSYVPGPVTMAAPAVAASPYPPTAYYSSESSSVMGGLPSWVWLAGGGLLVALLLRRKA